MIPFDFEYYAPDTIEEAIELYQNLEAEDKKPLYYSGGTEIISFSRHRKIVTGALIDLKGIADTVVFAEEGEKLVVGSCVTLSALTEQERFPLLAEVVRGIADRTVRNRLTLGGNICGHLPYREAVLPFLIGDADAFIAGPSGNRTIALVDIFDKRMRLEKGELLVKLFLPAEATKAGGWHKRREKHGPVDYPLLHIAALKLKNDGKLAVAVSGLCAYPFRDRALDELINEVSLSPEDKIEKSIGLLPGEIRADDLASADYRRALWQLDLAEMLQEMEGE